MTRLLLVALLLLVLLVATIGTAVAHGPCDETFDRPGASDFGRDHIAAHPPHGPSDVFHNPGTHMGYSLCLGVHPE